MRAEHRLDVRLHAVAEVGNRARGVGIEVPVRAPDDAASGAEGEEQLGRDGAERDDAAGGGRAERRVSPKSSVSACDSRADRFAFAACTAGGSAVGSAGGSAARSQAIA